MSTQGGASPEPGSSTAAPSLRLVGVTELQVPGRDVPFSLDRSAAALFAMLVLEGARQRDEVVQRLWPGSGSSDPKGNLRQLRKVLRRELGRECLHGTDTLALDADVQHDLGLLTGRVAADLSTDANPAGALDGLGKGDLLGTHAYDKSGSLQSWVDAQRARWRAARRARWDEGMRWLEAQGRLEAAVEVAERMLLEELHTEEAYVRVASLHWRRGDRSGARAVIARCRAMLARDEIFTLGPRLAELETVVQHQGAVAPRVSQEAVPAMLREPGLMVGRQAECRLLVAAWRTGTPVLLEGEPGIGKSRLLAEFALLHPSAVSVPAAVGDVHGPYVLLVRVLRAVLPLARPHCAAWVLEELGRLLPELGTTSDLPPYAPRLGEAVRETLALARSHGLTGLMLDDLQWADQGSLELLLHSAERLGALGPRWLMSCRHGHRPDALQRWAPLARGTCQVIELTGLDRAGLQRLMEGLGRPPRAALAWATALEPRTLGNPMFVLELLVAIRQQGGDDALAQDVPDPATWPASPTLVQLIQSRLRALSAPARDLARLATLADSAFSVTLAERVLGVDVLSLGPAWRALEDSGLLQDSRLGHNLLREAVRADLPDAVAKELHRRIAEAAAALQADPACLAHHWREAEHFQPAAQAFERAASAAAAVNLLCDELHHWDEAAACHDQLGDGDEAFRCRLKALDAALLVEPSDRSLQRATALQSAARSPAQQLDAWIAQAQVRENRDEATELVAAAEEIVQRLPPGGRSLGGAWATPRALRGLCLAVNGYSFAGRHVQAMALLETLRPAVEALPDPALQQGFLEAAGQVYMRAGHQTPGRLAFEAALALAVHRDDWTAAMIACSNLSLVRSREGDYASALATAEAGATWRQRLEGDVQGVAAMVHLFGCGSYCIQLGRYAQGIDLLQQAAQAFRSSGANQWAADAETHLARACLYLGQPARARALLAGPVPGVGPSALIRAAVALMVDDWAGEDIRPGVLALMQAYPDMMTDTRLTLQLLLARAQEGHDAVATARQALAEAQTLALNAVLQHARVALARALLSVPTAAAATEAAGLMSDVVALLPRSQPSGMYLAEAWWVACRAFASAGQAGAAADALAQGRHWLHDVAWPHVPETFRDGFLTVNPVNRALMGAADGSAGKGHPPR